MYQPDCQGTPIFIPVQSIASMPRDILCCWMKTLFQSFGTFLFSFLSIILEFASFSPSMTHLCLTFVDRGSFSSTSCSIWFLLSLNGRSSAVVLTLSLMFHSFPPYYVGWLRLRGWYGHLPSGRSMVWSVTLLHSAHQSILGDMLPPVWVYVLNLNNSVE